MKIVVANNGSALKFVSGGWLWKCRSRQCFPGMRGLSNDKDVCMEAVSERGEALIHCSAQMRVLDFTRASKAFQSSSFFGKSTKKDEESGHRWITLEIHSFSTSLGDNEQLSLSSLLLFGAQGDDDEIVRTAVSNDGWQLLSLVKNDFLKLVVSQMNLDGLRLLIDSRMYCLLWDYILDAI